MMHALIHASIHTLIRGDVSIYNCTQSGSESKDVFRTRIEINGT